MDETQHFCLRWNNYQSSITSAFENLRDDEDFVDVTLACEGRSIKAHRVVLSACSPYFRDLLKSTPCKHPVILLQDVNFLDLHSLVEFIYHGEVNVHQKSLQSFLKTAEVLRVSGLTQQQAEETHSQLAQIHNLANSAAAAAAVAGRNPINTHHTPVHEEIRYSRMHASSPPPPPQMPLASYLNNPLSKRGMNMMRRNPSTPSAEDSINPMKRIRPASVTGVPTMGDNGLPSSNNNSPDLMRSSSPQSTPADFSTIKHNNNNNTPPLKDEKRNGPTGNGNGTNSTGNGITTSGSDKLCSLTPSPLARSAEDVKTEPMELVCSNNQNTGACDENSNDSMGENDANHSSSVDGGKGSLSSVNDEEIENSLPSHPPQNFLRMSPTEPKIFSPAGFTFPMASIDSALAGFNSQLQQTADLAGSPQGTQHHNILRSSATSPSSTASAPPSPPTDLTSPTNMSCQNGGNSMSALNMHASPPHLKAEAVNGTLATPTAQNLNNSAQQMPLRMPPPTSGGINEPQECPYCRRTFSCYYSLKRHFQDKHEQSDTLYVCEFCHRRYRTKNSLTTHKSLQHRGSSGMLKRLLKTSAIKNVLVPHHHAHHQHHHHHASLTHAHAANLFDFTSELGQPPPGIQ